MKKMICLLLCMLLFTGCASHGTEEQMMVVLLGIDRTDDGSVKVIVKAPSFSGNSDPSSPSSGDGYLTLTASAHSFSAALTLLHATSPRNLNYSQTRQILLNQDVLRDDPNIIHTLGQISGMRSQTTLSICKDPAEDVMKAEKPVIGTRLSRYIDTTLETGIREGFIPDSTLIRVLTHQGGGYQDALIALTGLSLQDQQNQQQQQQAAPVFNQSTQHTAGNMPTVSGKAIQWMGSAALNGNLLTGYLSGFETMLCHFLTKNIGSMSFETPHGVLSCTPRYGPYLSLHHDGDAYTLCIRADLNVLPIYGASVDLAEADKSLTLVITQLLHTLQSLRSDALGFGRIAVRNYLTLDAWESSRWKEQYIRAQTDVDIRLTLVNE